MTFDHPELLLLLPAAPMAAAAAWPLVRRGALSTRRGAGLAALIGLSVVAMALAASGPRRSGEASIPVQGVIALDVSGSMPPEDLARAGAALRKTRGVPAVVGRIVFDEFPRPADLPGESQTRSGRGTDAAAALTTAQALLESARPDGTQSRAARRVFLVSDGAETTGDLHAAAMRLRAAGIAVDVGIAGSGPDVALVSVNAPPALRTGETARIVARVSMRAGHSSGSAEAPVVAAKLVLFAGETRISERKMELAPGERPVTFSWRPPSAGIRRLRVEVEGEEGPFPPEIDGRPGNESAETLMEVLPPPRVLLVDAAMEGDPPSLARTGFGAAGIGTRRIAPADLSARSRSPGGLPPPPPAASASSVPPWGWDLVVLDGVDPEALGLERIAVLSAFVRGGGGLLALPGAGRGREEVASLAKGSSPEAKALRRILPLATVDDEKKEPPPVAMVFILDKSDSMHRERKWEVASRTTASAYADMNPDSTLGVIAFSDFSDWVVPPARARDIPDFPERVMGIRLSGGTNMFPALEKAYAALSTLDSRLKHIVLLSDGVSTSRLADHEGLMEKIAAGRITVSTVAMGSEADQPTMERIARLTGGRSWFVRDPDDLPRIFAEETRRSTKDDLEPAPVGALRLKALMELEKLDPASSGWTPTTHARTRATSETIWQLDVADAVEERGGAERRVGRPTEGRRADRGRIDGGGNRRPLLARTRIGEGRSVALAAPAGAAHLDPGALFGGLAAIAVRAPGETDSLRVQVRVGDGGTARMELARRRPGSLGPGWSVQTTAGTGSEPARHLFRATGTDRAAVEIPWTDEGPLLARVLDPGGRPVLWASLPSPGALERLPSGSGSAAMRALAEFTGGDVMPAGELPAWVVGHAERDPGRPLRVPIGLFALGLAVASVWARRPGDGK